jgi:hypothetical protein
VIIVIPTAMEDDNHTIALAIESIQLHTDHDIVTVGHDLGVAEHIHCPQSTHSRDRWANTDRAMRAACERYETFIWSADDIYWTRPADPLMWALGDLAETGRRAEHGRRKQVTLEWLRAQDLPTWDYEAHVPMPIDAAIMLDVLGTIEHAPRLDKRTLYGNHAGIPDMIAPDVKVRTPDIADTPWLSSDGTRHIDLIEAKIRGDKAAYPRHARGLVESTSHP